MDSNELRLEARRRARDTHNKIQFGFFALIVGALSLSLKVSTNGNSQTHELLLVISWISCFFAGIFQGYIVVKLPSLYLEEAKLLTGLDSIDGISKVYQNELNQLLEKQEVLKKAQKNRDTLSKLTPSQALTNIVVDNKFSKKIQDLEQQTDEIRKAIEIHKAIKVGKTEEALEISVSSRPSRFKASIGFFFVAVLSHLCFYIANTWDWFGGLLSWFE